MSGSSPAPIEADRECLLQPLHDRGELQPVRRPDIEGESFFLKPKPPNLEGKALPRLTKYLIEDHRRLPATEERLAVIDRRPNLVPSVLY
jgi:hypothetical protein